MSSRLTILMGADTAAAEAGIRKLGALLDGAAAKADKIKGGGAPSPRGGAAGQNSPAVNTSSAQEALARLGAMADKTGSQISKKHSANVDTDKAVSALTRLSNSAKATGEHLGTLAKWGAAAGLAGVAAGAAASGYGILKLGADMEQTRVSFEVMLGSVEKSNAVLGVLADFANTTPFDNDQVNKAAKTLMAFGVKAEQIIPTMTMLGDAASGSGKDFNELSAIFGKAFAKGKADTETLNQLTEAGIPIIDTLGKMYGKTGEEIFKLAEGGKLSSDILSSAFQIISGKGGVFSDMMAKQSETLAGLWSTVVGKLQLAGSTIGEAILPVLKAGVNVIMEWTDELAAFATDGRAINMLATIGMTAVGTVANMIKSWNYLQAVVEGVWGAMKTIAAIGVNAVILDFYLLKTTVEGVWGTMLTLGQIAVTGVFSIVANLMTNIIDAVTNSVNAIINALNRISGLEISPIVSTEVMDKLKANADEFQKQNGAAVARLASGQDFKDAAANNKPSIDAFANEARDAAKRLASGQDFKDPMDKADSKNAAVDAKAAEYNSKIGAWQADQLDTAARRARDKAAREAELNTKFEAKPPPKLDEKVKAPKALMEEVKVDSLAKAGLYNFKGPATPAADMERNRILLDIKTILQGQAKQAASSAAAPLVALTA